VAKLSGMRVDEFGIGYPPRLWGKKVGETIYSVNALPFGGFVRIYGEDATDPDIIASRKAFAARPRFFQALTLIAGIAMNLLLAYVLIAATLIMGTPRALAPEEISQATDAHVAISDVLPGSPAEKAGLKPGDMVLSITGAPDQPAFTSSSDTDFLSYVGSDAAQAPLTFTVDRNNAQQVITVTPKTGVLTEDLSKPALGVAVTPVGVIPESFGTALSDGAIYTWEITKETAVGLAQFFAQIFTLHANLSDVSGPVGIAGAVGNAYAHGVAALLSIAAIISINLAIINLLPVPALDGGRLLFVIIEGIIRRPIKPSVAAAVNGVSFALLILLMVVVTGSDILKIIH
jgi:regulator of sigma E protease